MNGKGALFLVATIFIIACASHSANLNDKTTSPARELAEPGLDLSPSDVDAVRNLDRDYVMAWLADDPPAVMATLADDAVIIPSGMQPIRGIAAIRRFWWPEDGSTTVIDTYETRIGEVRGAGDEANAVGIGHLVFRYEKDGVSSIHSADSVFTMTARRESDGSWKMTKRMWSNLEGPPLESMEGRAWVLLAQAFRSLTDRKEFDAARALMAPAPRRWWDAREGDGAPWNVGPESGPWAAWDRHFGSERKIVRWTEGDRSASVIIRETNDYFRLLERGWMTNELVYYFDGAGKLHGLLVRSFGERPQGKTEEFREWAAAHEPDELEAVMPGGEVDPSHPERFRALLNRWRQETGRTPIP